MASLLDQLRLASDSNFQGRVACSAANSAINIFTEGTGVALHTLRTALGSKVLNNPIGYGQLMAFGVAGNVTVLADFNVSGTILNAPISPNNGVSELTIQNDIAFQVSSMWNAYT